MPQTTQDPKAVTRLERVPISHVAPKPGFNPRTKRDKRKFAALKASVARDGVTQPILVEPNPDREGDFLILAGESRYLAALDAGQPDISCAVSVEDDSPVDGLDRAVAENLLREDLSAMDLARALRRMREDGGLTVKGIAERLPALSQRSVREHLSLLTLPEQLYEQIDEGKIPMNAAMALVKLATIHADLPVVAVSRVQSPPRHDWDEPYRWSDVVSDPVAVVIGTYAEEQEVLPSDVFVTGTAYSTARFDLSEQATQRLGQLATLLDLEPAQAGVVFDADLTSQALALGAAHPTESGYDHLIVGQDIADQLAGDCIAAMLKDARKRAKRLREAEKELEARATDDVDSDWREGPAGESSDGEPLVPERSSGEIVASARAFNALLGGQLVKAMSRVKVDVRVLKILSAAPFADDFAKVAARGARLSFPGWPMEKTLKNGKVKVTYMEGRDAEEKAREYLGGADTMSEIAGRCLAVLGAARWADETVVPQSKRSFYELSFSAVSQTPWAAEVAELLDDILIERLSPEASAPIRAAKAEREAHREETERVQRVRQTVLLDIAQRAPGMSVADCGEEIKAIRQEHGYMTVDYPTEQVLLGVADPGDEPSSEDQGTTGGGPTAPSDATAECEAVVSGKGSAGEELTD